THGNVHAREAGLQEGLVQRVHVRQLADERPVLLSAPKVRIEQVLHILPLEGLLHETDVPSFFPSVVDVYLGVTEGWDSLAHRVERVEVLIRDLADGRSLELPLLDFAIDSR